VRARLSDIAGDDPEFVDELIQTFVAGGEDSVREIQAAAGRGELDMLARAAHRFKGACANLHIEKLAQLTLELEGRARAGQPWDSRQDVARIATEFARVAELLRAELSGGQRKAG
jgi:HPt (histidine-containing phosphotransfer) domain-containing protein